IAAFGGIQPGSVLCALFGTTTPLDATQLATLYPTHQAFVFSYRKAVNRALRSGFILKADAKLMRQWAAGAAIRGCEAPGASSPSRARAACATRWNRLPTRIQGLGPGELFRGLVVFALLAEDRTECLVHGCARLLGERSTIVGRRFFEVSLLHQRVGQIVVGRCELRVELDRLSELRDRFVRPAASDEHVSQAIVGLGGGPSRERLPVVGLGLLEIALLHECDGEVRMRRRTVRIELEGLLVVRERHFRLAQPRHGESEVAVDLRLGIELERSRELAGRLVE